MLKKKDPSPQKSLSIEKNMRRISQEFLLQFFFVNQDIPKFLLKNSFLFFLMTSSYFTETPSATFFNRVQVTENNSTHQTKISSFKLKVTFIEEESMNEC